MKAQITKKKKRYKRHVQLTLDKFIPIKIRGKKYRKQCAEILETSERKELMRKRSTIERTFAFLKKNLRLEDIRFTSFQQVLKYF
ncbi:MAG: transposase [Promethearchaeota archaeon]